MFWVLVRDMLLNKRGSLEELLTRFASKFALVLLLDVTFDRFGQFSAGRIGLAFLGSDAERKGTLLFVRLAAIVARVHTFSIDQQGDL